MANVQTKQSKRALEKEYFYRLLSVIFIFFTIAGLIGTVLLVPSFVVSDAKVRANQDQVDLLKEYKVLNESNVNNKTLERLAHQMKNLSELSESQNITDLITSVIKERGNVTLKSFSWARETEPNSEHVGKLFISGTAASRDSLIALEGRLRALDESLLVDLPIENLANRTNVDFALTLTLKKK